MDAGRYNIVTRQGSNYTLQFTIDDDGTPWIITGWTAAMQVRPFQSSNTVLLSLTNGNGITLGAGGTVTVTITGAQLSGMPAGTHEYDIELYDLSNTPFAVLEGKFVVKPEVTR